MAQLEANSEFEYPGLMSMLWRTLRDVRRLRRERNRQRFGGSCSRLPNMRLKLAGARQ